MAGFWSNLSKSFTGSHKVVSGSVAGPVGEAAGMVGKGVGHTMGAAGTAVGGTVGTVTGVVTGITKPLHKPLKILGIIAAVGVVAGTAAHYLRKNKKRDLPQEPMDMAPPIPDMSAMPGTMMGMQPQPGQFAAREDARRGATAGQQLGA